LMLLEFHELVPSDEDLKKSHALLQAEATSILCAGPRPSRTRPATLWVPQRLDSTN
jgi:hypothetical protein